MAELGPGERAERDKRRKLWAVIGVLLVTGAVTGFFVGYTESDEGFLQGTLPPWLAIGLTVLFLGSILIGTPLMLRNMDEVEKTEHLWFSAYGASAYVMIYPAWFLLWKGRVVPEPDHLILFGLFYLGGVIGYTARRYRYGR